MTLDLKEVLNRQIVGNAYHDRSLLADIDTIITDDTRSMGERKRAMNYLDVVLGLNNQVPATERMVILYTEDRRT